MPAAIRPRLDLFDRNRVCARTGCRSPQTRNRQRSGTAAFGSRGRTDSIAPTREAPHLQYVRDIRLAAQLIAASLAPQAEEILMRYAVPPGQEDLREFTWHYLLRRCHTERQTLTGHVGEVYNVEFSPDGTLLASAGKDGCARIWSTSSWQLVRAIPASKTEVNVAALSSNGQQLATVDDEGKLKLWEVATGTFLRETLAHDGDAVIARFTPDGKSILTGGRKDGRLKFWDVASGSMRGELPPVGAFSESAVFSPDGSKLATAGQNGVIIWNAKSRLRIADVPESRGAKAWRSPTMEKSWQSHAKVANR